MFYSLWNFIFSNIKDAPSYTEAQSIGGSAAFFPHTLTLSEWQKETEQLYSGAVLPHVCYQSPNQKYPDNCQKLGQEYQEMHLKTFKNNFYIATYSVLIVE